MLICYENLAKKTQKITGKSKRIFLCDKCNQEAKIFESAWRKWANGPYFSGEDLCNDCKHKAILDHPLYRQKVSKGVQKAFQENENLRNSVKKKGKNLGEKNGMKRLDVRKRMSKTRIENVTSDPEYRRSVSQKMRELWEAGAYAEVKVGRCKWYDFTKQNGAVIKLQGKWELAYAKWLDQNGVNFEAHRGRIPYLDNVGIEHSYYPDFYLIDSDEYIDIKCQFFFDQQREKFDLIRRSNPNLKLRILLAEDLEKLQINVKTL